MEEEISLVELFGILKKRMAWIINATLLGVLLAAVYTFFVAVPEYSSTTQLIVNRTQQSEVIQQSDINTNVQLINTYKDILKSPVVLDEVRKELDLDLTHNALSNKISIATQDNSQVFNIQVNDGNPFDAATIANTVASVFQEELPDIMNVNNVSVISESVPNETPISPNNTLNLAIGLVLGGMIGVGLAFLLEFMDNTVKDETFIVEELGWTSLGIISEMTTDELTADGSQVKAGKSNETRRVRSRV